MEIAMLGLARKNIFPISGKVASIVLQVHL
jgi:hypothetical protein